MRCDIFTDGIYHAEKSVEFDPRDVVAIEERSESLFLRGRHPVTVVTLRGGSEFVLRGSLKAEIEAARGAAAQNTP